MPASSRPLLIYIHGFQSSCQSEKAQETRLFLEKNSLPIDFAAPTLSNYPLESYRQLQQLIEQNQSRQIALMGSSMGGFTATALAQHYGLSAVVINPAVRPYELMSSFLGPNKNPYTGIAFTLQDQHVKELQQMEVRKISDPSRLMVLLQTGDEVLDYQKAVEFYRDCPQIVEKGGDHRFQNFEKHLPDVIKFLELAS
ncbi:MAG: YqiA/YcfP family alpha/beta fold hydrolase [Oceanicoccus sp.]